MSQDSPPESQPPAEQVKNPVLNYRGPSVAEHFDRRARRPLPPPLGYGFLAAVGILCVSWPLLAERAFPHLVIYIGATLAVIGISMLIGTRSRLVGIGVLTAVALWLLMVGSCSGIGFVKPGAI